MDSLLFEIFINTQKQNEITKSTRLLKESRKIPNPVTKQPDFQLLSAHSIPGNEKYVRLLDNRKYWEYPVIQ